MVATPLEQPKKVTTAYFLWLSENREAIAKTLGDKKGSAVAKAAGEQWGKLPAAKKAPFEKQVAEAKAKFDKDMAAFKAAGGVVAKRQRKGGKEKKVKDPNAPKKPVGGAYGVFLAEKRAEIVKSLPADSRVSEVTKRASVLWAAVKDKSKYEKVYQQKSEEYKKALEEYKKTLPAGAEEEDDEEEGDEDEEAEEDEAEEEQKEKKVEKKVEVKGKAAVLKKPAAMNPAKRAKIGA